MNFDAKYAGKWVAIESGGVVDSDTDLRKLYKRSESKHRSFSLVPKGPLSPSARIM